MKCPVRLNSAEDLNGTFERSFREHVRPQGSRGVGLTDRVSEKKATAFHEKPYLQQYQGKGETVYYI